MLTPVQAHVLGIVQSGVLDARDIAEVCKSDLCPSRVGAILRRFRELQCISCMGVITYDGIAKLLEAQEARDLVGKEVKNLDLSSPTGESKAVNLPPSRLRKMLRTESASRRLTRGVGYQRRIRMSWPEAISLIVLDGLRHSEK